MKENEQMLNSVPLWNMPDLFYFTVVIVEIDSSSFDCIWRYYEY